MSKPNLEKIGEQLKDVMKVADQGLEASGFEIEDTDIKLKMNDDYLWD